MNTRQLRAHLAGGGAALFDLSQRAKFRLSGEDRVRYLNGQVSNDIRKLTAHEARPACVMTAKGKMNGLIWVAAVEGALHIDADDALRESLGVRLERYIIADDAELEDVTEEEGLLHLLGFDARGVALPQEVTWAASTRFGSAGSDFFGPRALLQSWVEGDVPEEIRAACGGDEPEIVTSEAAESYRIECGIPVWGKELDENTIPVEAGLEEATIDYHKGCYIGQEIISRIKSIGRVNRHLRGFRLSSRVAEGTSLFEGEKQAGVLTSIAWSDAAEAWLALGYLKRGIEASTLRAGEATASLQALPFV